MAQSRFLPRFAAGLRTAWAEGYSLADLRHDVMAGLAVGTVAVPLSMALAIATGVPPQHGLYTAIVAGLVIALTGGARFNVSGPTAAFVVILFPIVQQYGLGGLLIASLMAGLILLALGMARLGRLIQFVPYPVVLGFTAGIAVVIATLQVPDFLGLELGGPGEHFVDSVGLILAALPTVNGFELAVGAFALGVMLLWPRLGVPVPAPLVGLAVGAVAAWLLNQYLGGQGGELVETIASRFSWEAQGRTGQGIPPVPPVPVLPWELPGPNGEPLVVSYELLRELLGPAFAIAMLGAIESLLCAVVADGLTKTRHDPDAELVGQGLGNIVAPFFGGITATAAIARTATNIRSGARSPVAAAVHALVVLLAVVGLSGLLGLVPMAALAALLFIVAWNMSEARHFRHALRAAPPGDVLVLLSCFSLTVLVDMVLAVAVGVGLAAALFIRRMAALTEGGRVDGGALPEGVVVYEVNGPLFFGAAEKALSALRVVDSGVNTVIIDMHDVPSMDGTAIFALDSLMADMEQAGVRLVLVGLPGRLIMKLRRAGLRKVPGSIAWCRNMAQANRLVWRWQDRRA
ncbi:C4-dicarboxylic acid transporter DauA [Alkalilimnicola sp. S0819]|uniref:C4-dicarboxylic acid transporter DauA n=1 Tax=Alkalilimnicola sp. S0819 TaxID=2613922 RepID=UPI0012614904|nr:C4-dicarboxylic acid transporter DauA [Alkalilimnicola sp. S0819]KAB7624366.1 C4-dicarboxylic acid transporter DauA [Alkalilimnicola sp. S0819]MPQ16192.1 C4-dicarboxylic acid transporter DauA [Alkalilimnicola sp. S0819]